MGTFLFGLDIFSVYLTPLIVGIAWLVCLVRFRSWILASATLLVVSFITSSTALLVTISNPYLMAVFLVLVLSNLILLPYADALARRYLMMADMVLLLMMAALHGWAIYLRRSDFYFYEQSDYGSAAWAAILVFLRVLLPVIAIIANRDRPQAVRWSIGLIVGAIVLGLCLGFLA